MARPNKYNDVILPRINEVKQWISEGLTDREIVANLGISESTWFKYKQKVSEFSETIKECRKPKVKGLPALNIPFDVLKKAIQIIKEVIAE